MKQRGSDMGAHHRGHQQAEPAVEIAEAVCELASI